MDIPDIHKDTRSESSLPVEAEKKTISPRDPWDQYYKEGQHEQRIQQSDISNVVNLSQHPENAYKKAEQQLRNLVESYKQTSEHSANHSKRQPNHEMPLLDQQKTDHNIYQPETQHHNLKHQVAQQKPSQNYHEKSEEKRQQNQHHYQPLIEKSNYKQSNKHHWNDQVKHPVHLSHLRQQPIIARSIGRADSNRTETPSFFIHQKPHSRIQSLTHQVPRQPLTEQPILNSDQQLQSSQNTDRKLSPIAPTLSTSFDSPTTPQLKRRPSHLPHETFHHPHSHARPNPKRIVPISPPPNFSSQLRLSKTFSTSDCSDLDNDERSLNAGQTITKPSAKVSLKVRIRTAYFQLYFFLCSVYFCLSFYYPVLCLFCLSI